MNEVISEKIQELLGWKPASIDEGRFTDLNDLPDALIITAQRLPPLLRHAFISHYAGVDNLDFVSSFIDEVIEHGSNAASWHRGRILVPGFTPKALVQLTVDEIVAPLAPKHDEQWYQLKPRRDYWDAREFLTGAPAVLRSDLNYRYTPPENVRDLLMPDLEVSHIDDIKIATRRWVAANLARAAASRNLLDIGDPAELLHACFPDAERISIDGFIAAKGLIRELTLPESSTEVPGFRGPDMWYREKN